MVKSNSALVMPMMQPDHMGLEKPPTYSQSLNLLSSDSIQLSKKLSSVLLEFRQHDQIQPPMLLPLQEQEWQPGARNSLNTVPIALSSSCEKSASPYLSSNINQLEDNSTITKRMKVSEVHRRKAESELLIDDPNVLLAAKALEDLRADCRGSPQQPDRAIHDSQNRRPEPLLSLLVTSHPLIGNAIGGSLSAYSASKSYSPRFKSSAEFVEKQFTPVVNTVGSVGRMTGMDEGVRWILGGRRENHHTPSDAGSTARYSKKRRKLEDEKEKVAKPLNDQYSSLPRDLSQTCKNTSKSSITENPPAYNDVPGSAIEERRAFLPPTYSQIQSSSSSSWHSRLALSTSGFSVAMSEESLRSLRYCLGRLRWANEHLAKMVKELKIALDQYEDWYKDEKLENKNERLSTIQGDAEHSALGARIEELKKGVMKILKEVVDTVSKYAGGTLPDNSRVLVHRLLTSLPERFRIANSRPTEDAVDSRNTGSKFTKGTRRVLLLAKESLDMMAQVASVLNSTIESAEDWFERFGFLRERREESFSQRNYSPDSTSSKTVSSKTISFERSSSEDIRTDIGKQKEKVDSSN